MTAPDPLDPTAATEALAVADDHLAGLEAPVDPCCAAAQVSFIATVAGECHGIRLDSDRTDDFAAVLHGYTRGGLLT